jgi:hypothetical protein
MNHNRLNNISFPEWVYKALSVKLAQNDEWSDRISGLISTYGVNETLQMMCPTITGGSSGPTVYPNVKFPNGDLTYSISSLAGSSVTARYRQSPAALINGLQFGFVHSVNSTAVGHGNFVGFSSGSIGTADFTFPATPTVGFVGIGVSLSSSGGDNWYYLCECAPGSFPTFGTYLGATDDLSPSQLSLRKLNLTDDKYEYKYGTGPWIQRTIPFAFTTLNLTVLNWNNSSTGSSLNNVWAIID